MDSRNIFWGLIIKPGKRYETEVQEPFRITKACIEPSSAKDGKLTSVMVECDSGEEFIVCSLNMKVFNETLDISFNEGEKICFKVEGPGTVHLTGNLMEDAPPGEMFDMETDSDDVNDSEEEEEEEEKPGQKRKKKELVNGNAKMPKKALEPEITDDEEDDDEDDDDEDSDDEDEDTSIGDTTADTTAATEGSDDSEDDDEDDDSDSEEEEKVATPKKGKAVNGTATPKGDTKKKSLEETPKQAGKPNKADVKTPKQEAKTPKQEAKTPKQEAKTPKQEAKTPKQEAKTQKEGAADKTPKETKTPKQDLKTPKEESKTPKDSKTPKEEKTPKRTLKGGIQVEEVKEGNGPECKAGNMVGMYYEGRLKSNNKRFDGLKEGKPFKFKLGSGQVIKGWDIGVLGMKVGGKRKLTIPPKLAYGASGAPPDIPPNSTLVFEIECKFVK